MFRFKQFAVRQDRCPMKVGTDGVLLGAWAEVRPGDRRMLDVGTGTGLIALLLGNWTNGAATTQYFSVYRSSLADPLTYVRFFGHVLGHSGYDHYMGNMLLLLLVGPGLEEKYGSGTMVWMIALTALVTGLVNFIFFPHTALLGASGVVFMMIVLSSFTAARKGEIPVTLILVVIFYLGGEIMDGLFKQDNVSQIAHIVGGLCGLVFGFTVRRGRR